MTLAVTENRVKALLQALELFPNAFRVIGILLLCPLQMLFSWVFKNANVASFKLAFIEFRSVIFFRHLHTEEEQYEQYDLDHTELNRQQLQHRLYCV